MQTQQTQNSFLGPKSYRDFRETGPSAYKGKGVGGGSYLGGGDYNQTQNWITKQAT